MEHAATADSMAFSPQVIGQLARTVERQLQMQFVDPSHQQQIPLRLATAASIAA